jgi:Helix-turn-helix.
MGLAESGLTQAELGDAIGWTGSAVGAWLNCQNVISIEAALRISDVFSWPPGDLFVRAGLVPRSSVLAAIEADGALDEQARAEVLARYRAAIGEAARRRIAALTQASEDDSDRTLSAEELFGPEWPRKVANL